MLLDRKLIRFEGIANNRIPCNMYCVPSEVEIENATLFVDIKTTETHLTINYGTFKTCRYGIFIFLTYLQFQFIQIITMYDKPEKKIKNFID